ncbi:MAG: AsmA-like C-terminal region-containing protein, partial [Candidatus Gastranaerophilales bacterium]|nr:AsmA-like C-terminal region-containing protein [Candidatus Gastranaerophilales bacterium]
YITQEEKISILGLLNYGKNPKTDLKINSSKINPNDVLNLIKATLASLHVKNDLDSLNGSGSFEIDTYIKTNFKKLESSGNITVKDCIIKDVKKNLTLLKANSIISLDNNMLKFVDTSIEVIDTLFKIDGTVDNKSKADLSVIMEKLPLAKVFSFLPAEISGNYSVKSGDININATIKGELKKADADFTLNVAGIDLTDKINKINYKNNQFTAKFTGNLKKITGNITNNGFKLSMNGAAVNCDSISVDISEKDININPAQININNSSVLNLSGSVLNYIKKPAINFDVNGNLVTKDLKQLAGSDIAMYIKEKGALPVNININGDGKKQTLTASIEADKDNYFTPVDIKNTENKNTTLKTVVDFKGDRLKIKDTGFFIKTISQDTENPEKTIVNYEEVVSIDGTITKLNSSTPNINLIKIKIPEELNAVLCVFPQSALKAKGNLFVFGDLDNPRIRGGFNIWDISIPELFLTVDKIAANFEGKNLDVDIKNILANSSDYNILINADLSPSEYFTIKNLNLTSALTDVDKLMKVSDEAMKYVPAQTDTTSSAGTGDIPVIIKDGAIDIKSIKTGNINMTDTTAKISLLNNIFYVNNLITNGFKGKIKGDVSLNLISSEIKAVLKGSGLDVEQALLDAAAMKDTLTGTLDFDTDISLKGATYEEQMKSLAGTVNFAMKNGSLGPFGKLENLILAENIRENSFFQSTIGSILNSLLSFDTAHYNTLNGTLLFKDGIVDISSIKSSGDIMATHIFGDFNLLSNKIDIKLRGKLGSQVSDSMGYLSMVNPVNLVKATPGMSLVFGKIFFLFTETVTEADMAQIPSLGKDISDTNTTKFQVVVRGDVAKPLTLVKSFKWMALQSDIDNANSYVNSISSDTLPAQIEGLTSIDTETVKTEVTEGVKNAVEQAASDSVTQTVEKIQETVTNTMEQSENTKQGILQNLKNKIKNIKTENTSETEE